MEPRLLIHWPYLVLALALLWFPRPWLRAGRLAGGRRRPRELAEKLDQDGARDPGDLSVRLDRELRQPRNFVDLLRAVAGGVALWHFALGPISREDEPGRAAVAGALTLAGLLVQSVRRAGGRVTLCAPLFYCAGLTLAIDSPVAGGFAVLLAGALNPVLPSPRAFLAALALALVPFGYFLGHSQAAVLCNVLLLVALPLLSLLARRPLVIFSRQSKPA